MFFKFVLLAMVWSTAALVMIVVGYYHAKAVRRSERKIMRQYAKDFAAAFKTGDRLSLVAISARRFAESRGISREKVVRTLERHLVGDLVEALGGEQEAV